MGGRPDCADPVVDVNHAFAGRMVPYPSKTSACEAIDQHINHSRQSPSMSQGKQAPPPNAELKVRTPHPIEYRDSKKNSAKKSPANAELFESI